MSAAVSEVVSVADLVAAVRRQQAPRQVPCVESAPGTVRGTCVLGAHPGAGATVVAVAIIDALDGIGHPATLVDLASTPDAFAAVECEVDSKLPGWRAGRRGRAQVLRRRTGEAEIPEFSSDLIVDGRIETLTSQVLVCRATLPSVGRVDEYLPDDAVVAVVGSSRWPKVVAASLSRALRHAADDGRIVFVPHNKDLELYGVDAAPLPTGTQDAGRRVVELLWPDLAGSSAPQRGKGRRR